MRTDIQTIARSWIGTPYRHQAATKGVGCDCLGLLRGVWAELGLGQVGTPITYPQSWPKTQQAGQLSAGLAQYLIPISRGTATTGDVVLCRLTLGGPIVHAGILSQHAGVFGLIHAHSRFGVQETPFDPLWARLAQLAFRFPQ